MCALTFVGLLVHAKIIVVDPILYPVYAGNVNVDFFSYFKAQYLIGVVAIATLVMIYGLVKDKTDLLRFKRVEFYLLLAMALLAILSTVFSKYPSVALKGSPDRYEGLWVWLCYLIIPFLMVHFIRSKEQLERFIKVLLIPSFLIMLIGALQFLGYDIFNQPWSKYLLFTDAQRGMISGYEETASGVYSTLYNQNYVGSFAVIVVPILLYLLIDSIQQSKRFWVVLSTSGLLFSGVSILGSYSSGGYVAVSLSLCFFLIYAVLMHTKGRLKSTTYLFVPILLLAIWYTISITTQANNPMFGEVITQTEDTEVGEVITREILDVKAEGHEVKITTTLESFTLRDEDKNLRFLDDSGHDIVMGQIGDTNTFMATDDRYKGYRFNFFLEDDVLEIVINKNRIPVLLNPDGLQVIGLRKMPIQMKNAEYWGFEGEEQFGSYRGYIWSRSLPLVKETVLLGHGPDTFAFYFPQNDLGRLNKTKWRTPFVIIDKPHNTYLQIAVQLGATSALLYIIVFILLFKKLLFVDYSINFFLKATVLSALFGYLIITFVNDSIVSVSPYFWIIHGISLILTQRNAEIIK